MAEKFGAHAQTLADLLQRLWALHHVDLIESHQGWAERRERFADGFSRRLTLLVREALHVELHQAHRRHRNTVGRPSSPEVETASQKCLIQV